MWAKVGDFQQAPAVVLVEQREAALSLFQQTEKPVSAGLARHSFEKQKRHSYSVWGRQGVDLGEWLVIN